MAKKTTSKPTVEVEELTIVDSGMSLDEAMALDAVEPVEDDGLMVFDDLAMSVDEPEPPKKETKAKAKDPVFLDDLDDVPAPEPEPVREEPKREIKAPMTKFDAIEAMIKDVGDVPEYMTIVVYGKNGTGKTTFGASGDRTLVVEVEKDGTFSVRKRGSAAKKYPVKTFKDFIALYWYLRKKSDRFDIVCIDTLTRLSEICLRDIVFGEGTTTDTLLESGKTLVTRNNYGDNGREMIKYLSAFMDLPFHKVWLCQEDSGGEDEDVRDFEVYPALQKSIRTYVCSDATIIGRTMIRHRDVLTDDGSSREIAEFLLVVKPSPKWLSKDRTNALGQGMKNPKIDNLIKMVYDAEASEKGA